MGYCALVPSVGPRIREERLARGISLRALAREVGVSASLISQIETGKAQPSVSTLYAITSVLGLSVQAVFEEPPPAAGASAAGTPAPGGASLSGASLAAAVRAAAGQDATVSGAAGPGAAGPGGAGPTTVLEAIGSAYGARLGPLVRPSGRQVLTLDSGATWERLGVLPGQPVEFLRITYSPGGTSSSGGELMCHRGAEYGILLGGQLLLTLGAEEIPLHPGDAVSFDSSAPHRYRNNGTEPAVGIWCVAY